MNVVFFASDKAREHMLAEAMGPSIRASGASYRIVRTAEYGEEMRHEGPIPGTDLAIVFGVKGKSRQIIEDHRLLGIGTLYLDKGISRQKGTGGHTEYTRVFVNGMSPAHYITKRKFPADRFRALKLRIEPRRTSGDYVLFCGSSQKYHEFRGLPPSQEFAEGVIKRLTKLTDQLIVFRPKPSDRDARPIPNAAFSHAATDFGEALRRASCLVTHGSSAGVWAILAGVPVISLGDSICSPVAESSLENIRKPFWPDDALRGRWASAMAYCQWTTKELEDGTAWRWISQEVARQCA